MKIFFLLYIHFWLITNEFVNVIHSSTNTPIISQNNLISQENKRRKQICQPSSEFVNSKQQVYLIQATKQFKVTAFHKEFNSLTVTGISRSIYNRNNSLHESEIVVTTNCKPQIDVVNYNLYLNISMNNQSFLLPAIPIKLICYPFNHVNKFQYVLLQFMMATLFLCSNIFFTYVNSDMYRFSDPIILIILVLSVFHKAFSLMFNLFCIMRLIHACFTHFIVIPNRIQRMVILCQGIISISIIFVVKTAESSFLWIHYLENSLTIIGIGVILKITRLRYLLFLWLTLYFFYKPFTQLTQNHQDLQFYFPALSSAKSYTCVSINILELALPLVFSIFFIRFSEKYSYNKKIYLMFNFLSYIIINVFSSILILKDNTYRLTAMANINSIIFFGVLLSILESNFSKLPTFRLN